MPIYILNGKNYTIPDNLADKFENENPGATVKVMGGGNTIDIPVAKKQEFFDAFKDAAYQSAQPSTAAPGSAQQQVTEEKPDAATEQKPVEPAEQKADSLSPWTKPGEAEARSLSPWGKGAALDKQPEGKRAERLDPKYQLDENGQLRPFTPLESEKVMDEEGNVTWKPKMVKGEDGTDVYRDVYGREHNPMEADTREMVEENTLETSDYHNMQSATREQVASMSADIAQRLKQRGEEIDQNMDNSFMGNMVRGGGMAGMPGYVASNNGRLTDPQYKALQTAQTSLKDAQAIIDEADHNKQSGDFGAWLESSFAGGAARGFGEKLFDARTWDMGLSDGIAAGTMLDALKRMEKGEQISEEERMMLDAKAVELATNAYFGSYVGRGYKAGAVTAESLPFMLEMCINPASAAGETAQAMLTRYALKRFGKNVVKDNAKKYLTAKVATRLVGDIAGSATMTATTGLPRTLADAEQRMVGKIEYETDPWTKENYFGFRHDQEEDFATAFAKAFKATTIENYSEMVGEYFAPAAEIVGKGARWTMNKIGLGKVNEMIKDVAMSDVAKAVGDFEKHAKWNGTFGEFAEEQVGGMMNAILVGDQTMGEVWSKDNMIDTFLGVSLMGGVFSAVKTMGYRTPTHRARKEMMDADVRAAAVMGDPEAWSEIKSSLDGTDEQKQAVLAEVADADMPMAQKQAIFDYARKAEEYAGVMQGTEKRRAEEENAAQVDAEASFDNGYSLETPQELNDAKNWYEAMRENVWQAFNEGYAYYDVLYHLDGGSENDVQDPVVFLSALHSDASYTDEQKQTALDYLNAKATYDGMIQRVRDDIDSQIAVSDAAIDQRVSRNADQVGSIVPATMKQDDRQVYVIDGTVKMLDDGTMVDTQGSSESILVRDAETGKLEWTSPHDILRVDEPLNAEQEKEEARKNIRQSIAQQKANEIDGVLPFAVGDKYNVLAQDGTNAVAQVMADNGDGTVTVMWNNDPSATGPVAKDELQQMSDAENEQRLAQHAEQKKQQHDEEKAEEVKKPARHYTSEDIVVLRDADGLLVRGQITNEANEDGLIGVLTERPLNGRPNNMLTQEELDNMVESVNGEVVEKPVEADAERQRQDTETDVPAGEAAGTVAEPTADAVGTVAPSADAQGTVAEPAASVEQEPMPMKGEGEDMEPDFEQTTPERGYSYLFGESGLEEKDAASLMTNNLTAAKKEADKLKAKKPKIGTSIAKYNKDMAAWTDKVKAAEARQTYWQQMMDLRTADNERRREEQRLADASAHDAAVAANAAEQQEMERKAAEQAAVGTNNVAPAIREKWEKAQKTEGSADEVVLANGEKITGKYVLVESDAPTASHDAEKGFVKSEGFPVDENGGSVNDRDYERDTDAQTQTRIIADNYDSRALQSPVVVSQDGVVLSGNGRTMAGKLAASQGTDKAYLDYLKDHASKYGFTAEQVAGMQHPRVVFVADGQQPYTAETFAKFNAQEMKSQSKTEQAVKLGKVVDDKLYGRIIDAINGYDTLGDFYASSSAVDAMTELQKAGVVSQAQFAEMFDGESVSAVGRELLENMLIGKAFESNPDALREISAMKGVRQAVISALSEITNNVKLGEDFSLEDELAAAIDLVYKARKEGGYKEGDRVSGFASQGNLGFLGEEATVADITNVTVMKLADVVNSGKPTMLRNTLRSYNAMAFDSASGQLDIFAGLPTKDEIMKDSMANININNTNNGTEKRQEGQPAAGEARNAEAAPAERGGEGQQSGSGNVRQTDEWQGGLGETEGVRFSDEVDENGKRFVLSSEGDIAFGTISEETGLTPAPIQLSEGMITDPATNAGYGLVHIEARHGNQIRNAGYNSVVEFVEEVAKNYQRIKEANDRDGHKTYLLQLTDRHNNTLIVELAGDEAYWTINTAGIFKESYGARNREVYNRHTTVNQSTETDSQSLDEKQSGTSASTSMLETTPRDETIGSASEVQNGGSASTGDASQSEPNADNGSSSNGTASNVSVGKDSDNADNEQTSADNNAKKADISSETEGADGKNAIDTGVPGVTAVGDGTYIVDGRKECEISSYKGVSGDISYYAKMPEGMDKVALSVLKDAKDWGKDGIMVFANSLDAMRNKLRKVFAAWDKQQPSTAAAEAEEKQTPVAAAIASAEAETEQNPTDAQKEAGNYKKGHVKVDGYDITIENPKGSVRSGKDASGKEWSITMNNTYGYIRGTEGVDGDHIDIFLSDNPEQGNVYVVDQVDADGNFDEHKVMYGFGSAEEARDNYLANYEKGWKMGIITEVSKEEFKKWIESSHRKTKPFSEYKGVKKDGGQNESAQDAEVKKPAEAPLGTGSEPNADALETGSERPTWKDADTSSENYQEAYDASWDNWQMEVEDKRLSLDDLRVLLDDLEKTSLDDYNETNKPYAQGYAATDAEIAESQRADIDALRALIKETEEREASPEYQERMRRQAEQKAKSEKFNAIMDRHAEKNDVKAAAKEIAEAEDLSDEDLTKAVDAATTHVGDHKAAIEHTKRKDVGYFTYTKDEQKAKIDGYKKRIKWNEFAIKAINAAIEIRKEKMMQSEVKDSDVERWLAEDRELRRVRTDGKNVESFDDYMRRVATSATDRVASRAYVYEVYGDNVPEAIEDAYPYVLTKDNAAEVARDLLYQQFDEDGCLAIFRGILKAKSEAILPFLDELYKIKKEAADAAESPSLHALREHVRTLAEEMDVKLPENFDTMTEEQLRNALDRGEEMKKGRERLAAAKYKVGDKVRDTNGHELEVVRVYIVREEPVNGVVEHTVYYDLKEGKKKPFAQPERNLDMWQEMNEQRAEADAKRQRQNTEETVDDPAEPAADATGTGAESAEPAGEAAGTEAEPAADAVGTVAEPTGETVGTEADGTTGKQQRKRKVKQKEDIEDVGEKIAGARKDMKLEIAKSIDDATVQSLIELAFSKAYKKPNLAKAVESGALREKDATFYYAWFNTTINQTKPKLTQRDSRMKKWRADYVTPVERWAQSTYERLQFLKEFVEADEEKRDEMIERVLSDKYLNVDADKREIARIQSLNPHLPADTWGECWTPNPMVITYEVMERLGYKVGDKLDIPFGMLQPNSHFTSYSLTNAKGDRPYDATVLSLEDGINRIVSMAKLKRGDGDIKHPLSSFRFIPTKKDYRDSGRYSVTWGGWSSHNSREFDTKEEAEAFAAKKKDAIIMPIREISRRYGYQLNWRNPINGDVKVVSRMEFDTAEDAAAYLDENYEAMNDAVNEMNSKENGGKKRELAASDLVTINHTRTDGKWSYGVFVPAKYGLSSGLNAGKDYLLKDGFETRDEAMAYAESMKEDLLKAYNEYKQKQKAFVYFDTGENSRMGEDYRGGADVTAEDFMNAFGFRGVQFGNWTNQADRQMAVNQAYDAFMDLAKLIGVSPRALSLNGELGIAFGARGNGGALAHYEPNEVVINLTKTKGAGSLAHEWWHALDNYLSRKSGVPMGMVTDSKTIALRDELRTAFNRLIDEVSNSDYYRRSVAKGEYWGRMHEVTARLLAEWVDRSLKKNGELNTFLARGVNSDRWVNMTYAFYRWQREKDGSKEKMLTREEWAETPEALNGFPYPSDKEVEQFGDAMRNIFDVIDEREHDGHSELFQIAAGEPYTDNRTAAQMMATQAVLNSLSGNTGIGVVMESQEEGQRVAGMDDAGAELMAVEAVKDETLDYFRKSVSGDITGKPMPIGKLTPAGREYLMRLSGIDMKEDVDFVLNPSDMTHIYNEHYGENEKDPGNNNPLNDEDIRNIVDIIENPDEVVFFIDLKHDNRKTFIFFKETEVDGVYNLAEVYGDRKGNLTAKSLYKTKKGISQREDELINSPHTTSVTTGASLSFGAKIPQLFELPKLSEGNQPNTAEFMKVWHGSAAIFDHFDGAFMGTGEGSNVYGAGHYVSQEKGIGESYASIVATGKYDVLLDGKPVERGQAQYLDYVLGELKRFGYSIEDAASGLEWYYETDAPVSNSDSAEKRQARKAVELLRSGSIKVEKSTRHLYEVEIPEDNGKNYIDWNNRMTPDQMRVIASAIAERRNSHFDYPMNDKELGAYKEDVLKEIQREAFNGSCLNSFLQNKMAMGNKAQSQFLAELGFVGNKVPTYNRHEGDKSKWNYVLFRDDDLTIKDRVDFMKRGTGTVYGWSEGNRIHLTPEGINPNTPIHEYTHLWAKAVMQRNPELWANVKELLKGTPIWDEVVNDPAYDGLTSEDAIASEALSRLSGRKNADKMVQMAQQMLDEAKDKGVMAEANAHNLVLRMKQALEKFWRWVGTNLFDMKKFKNIDEVTDRVLFDLLNKTDLGLDENGDAAPEFSRVTDQAKIDELEGGRKIKVYRAMQLIDGQLYPPMAAMSDSKTFVQPSELGKWEQADEKIDNAIWKKNKKGELTAYFRLRKGNGKYVDAAYNPYFHTSLTPLNDQFSEAQSRPNLVTVEMEIPESELTSGYKAYGAKDAVGKLEWKAGIIQGQLTGTRTVMLSRYAKPVRIVSDAEVADVIVDMFGGKKIVMPSNVVTPSLREELEKLGVPFVETNNQGHLIDGEHEGEHYSKVYGDNRDAKRGGQDTNNSDAERGGQDTELEEVNDKFNAMLSSFSLENADRMVFDLGDPSEILKGAGIADKRMKLYGNKIAKKLRKHGFSVDDLRDLPLAMSKPIAVFDNYSKDGNRSVLTELKTKDGNVLVAVDLGKGGDIDFNIISTVFGKNPDSVENWLEKGLATYIDNEKVRDYLHLAAPIAAASDNTGLSSGAKIQPNNELNKLLGEKLYIRTENFKNWFGDWQKEPKSASKVVDENGEPLVVYHGTQHMEFYFKDGHPYTRWTEPFYTFKEGKGFFTDDEDAAKTFARGRQGLYACYLNMRNPFEFDCKGMSWDELNGYDNPDGYTMVTTDYIVRDVKSRFPEYDGVIFRNVGGENNGSIKHTIDDYVPFKPEQIKSATDNNGEFDGSNTDIRFREKTEFDEGQVMKVTMTNAGEYDPYNAMFFADTEDSLYRGREYMVEGLTTAHPSKAELLNAFREKHGAYMAELTKDGSGIVVHSWRKLLEEYRKKQRGTQRRSAGNGGDYVSRKTRAAMRYVQEMADKLKLGNVEVRTDTEGLSGRQARSKGWYDTRSGKIVIVLANHTDVGDVLRTLLHEGVGHYGLRKMFGKDFDTFLDNVYQNVTKEIRQKIADKAARNGWDFRVATEEYLSELAEDQDFEYNSNPGWWNKVKELFVDMLRKAGFKLAGDGMTDNDLRYIVWKSYENLRYGEDHGVIRSARTELMKQRLGVGYYEEEDGDGGDGGPKPRGTQRGRTGNGGETQSERPGNGGREVADDGDAIRYRSGGLMDERDRIIVRDAYDAEIASSTYQMREAAQDSMLSLRRFMEMIAEKTGRKVEDFENAYIAENAKSSINGNEQKLYRKMLFEPLLDEVHNLAKDGSSRDEVTRYMMAKHGLERQEYMQNRAIANDEDADRDFAGLTGLTEKDDINDAIAEAERMVADFEAKHDVTDLWAKTNACTKATLDKAYRSGMLSKDGYEKISKMYEYYIPLRGFKDPTSEDVYSYLNNEGSPLNNPVKNAEGRSSVSFDPLANIQSMADSAIIQGNQNMVKQKFLKFVMNNPSDLVSVNRMWLQYNDVAGRWEAVTADINDGDSPAEVLRKTEQFEQDMEARAQSDPDHYKRGRDAANLPYRALGKNLNEHMVHVKMGGQDYVITVNGSPRLAQAINGMTNPDNRSNGWQKYIENAGRSVNRKMSAFYTTKNPEFVLSNFLRDALYSNTSVWIKERPNYAIRFNRNFMGRVNPWKLFGLLKKHESGTLNMSDPMERDFSQFMAYGGETGYAFMESVKEDEKHIEKYMKMKEAKIPVRKAWSYLADVLENFNRSVELCARFSAYVTSREMGRTMERSVNDAKEISVNFNKKGAGSTFVGKDNQTKLGNVAAFVSGVGGSSYVFWNAAVQGVTNFGRLNKRHTGKALTAAATLFVLGIIMASIGGGGDDEDYYEDEYHNIPPYKRRNNICFKIPGTNSYATIPLPKEFAGIYGLGELCASLLSGKERMSGKEIAAEMGTLVSNYLPLDIVDANGKLSPSVLVPSYLKPLTEAYITNENWMGIPVYKKTMWNERDPEWTKAYKHTNKYLVDFAKAMNEWTGGDDVTPGGININPARIEHVLEGTFGGVTTFTNKLVKAGETMTGDMDFEWRNMPMASRVVTGADDQAMMRRVDKDYRKYKEEYDQTKRRASRYRDMEYEGVLGAAERIDYFENSKEYGRYEILDGYVSAIRNMEDRLKELTDKEEIEDVQFELTDMKREVLAELHEFDDMWSR